ncbi:MAG TPA: ATP-binding protein, partial [Geobacteraceae bacterium]
RKLYDYALDQAVFLTGSEIGFFHLVSEDQKELILATWSNEVLDKCTGVPEGTHYPVEEAGNWVDCVRLGHPVIYNDYPSSPNRKGLPDGHMELRRFMSVPVFDGDKVRYIFGVGNKAGEYGDYDVIHVQLVASELQKIFRQRRSEEALRQAAVYNRGLIEASLDPLVTIGTDGTITDVNSATEAITGCSRETLIGTDFSVYFTDPAKARAGYRQTFREGTVRDYSLEIRDRQGRVTPVLYNASVFRDEGGDITGVFAAARDVTELRHLETQLRQAQKLEAIGTLAGGVAHDFNNILTAIVGFGSILEMKMAPDDPLLANVKQILGAADRAAALTRSLLAFSRKQTIAMKAVSLNAIVSGIEKMLRRLIREDIELCIHLAEEELTIQGDAGQIEQVLLNLTTNARDAMDSGGVISVSTGLTELDDAFRKAHGYGTPGRYALITFSDSGDGIPEDVRQRIFEPFFSTKEVGKGTGLGLSVCYGIVKHHNGYITCYSEPGQGTTFRIYLPLAREEARCEGEVAEVYAPGGTETLLVAEDDPTVRALTKGILTEFGYTVIEAGDGEEAVARFRERPEEIRLCLFDVVMPKMRGAEACEEIRRIRPGTRVLFMSGYQEDVSLHKGLVAEGVEIIAKPVMPQELLRKVREALNR